MVAAFNIPVASPFLLRTNGMTHIEVWASFDLGNTYQEITAPFDLPAVLGTSKAVNLFRLGGCLLSISINGALPVDILFGTVLPLWTPTQVRDRINEVVPGLASLSPDDGKSILLTSPTVGRSSTLRITYSDARSLGLETGTFTFGRDARIPLDDDVLVYPVVDTQGIANSTRYKWLFSNNGAQPRSEFSDRILGGHTVFDPALVSLAKALFIGLDGRPKKTTVIVTVDQSPMSVAGYVVGADGPKSYTTGDDGFLVVTMLRGLRVRVAIDGTALVREIVVPDTPSFDLLEALGSARDPYTPVEPLPFLNRRSL